MISTTRSCWQRTHSCLCRWGRRRCGMVPTFPWRWRASLPGPRRSLIRVFVKLQVQRAVPQSHDQMYGLFGVVGTDDVLSTTLPEVPARRGRVSQRGGVDGQDDAPLLPPSSDGVPVVLELFLLLGRGTAVWCGPQLACRKAKTGPQLSGRSAGCTRC